MTCVAIETRRERKLSADPAPAETPRGGHEKPARMEMGLGRTTPRAGPQKGVPWVPAGLAKAQSRVQDPASERRTETRSLVHGRF